MADFFVEVHVYEIYESLTSVLFGEGFAVVENLHLILKKRLRLGLLTTQLLLKLPILLQHRNSLIVPVVLNQTLSDQILVFNCIFYKLVGDHGVFRFVHLRQHGLSLGNLVLFFFEFENEASEVEVYKLYHALALDLHERIVSAVAF